MGVVFSVNDDFRLLQESAKRFFGDQSPVSSFRQVRDESIPLGYQEHVWLQMVELGFPATLVPEIYGGMGLGMAEMGCLLEEVGRNLSPSPLFATAFLCAKAISLWASEAQKGEWLSAISAGGIRLALAFDEDNHHRGGEVMARVEEVEGGYLLNGVKQFVLDGNIADQFLVLAGHAGNKFMMMVPSNCDGVVVQSLAVVDSRSYANVRFEGVFVPFAMRLGNGVVSEDSLQHFLDCARAGVAAEMLGACLALFDQTVAYLRERSQFGVKIGSFQALKHRAARMYTELELSISAVRGALIALDTEDADAAKLACLAKVKANNTAFLLSNEAVQMHGGMGVTDELDIGLYLKRVRTLAWLFGDSRYLSDRYATLSGY
ncbi:MAG: acyl-CoA dehydrogenase [Marinomonas primoryensis]|jgi:acyl-CoA dehydrogenase